MKVVLVGGYGVFGSLLSELLARDGHEVWIAGRNLEKAQEQAARIGGQALQVDLFKAPDAVFAVAPDVVVDAAGPYQLYGDDPYKLAKLCIGEGVHYLDLSDSAAFTTGISKLDETAKAEGVSVLSGASSVPGLSSVVVRTLAADLDEIVAIESAILPGNKAPRGRSVIASIIGSVGEPMRLWQGDMWMTVRGWSGGKTFQLDERTQRKGYQISVPDCALFPAHFRARSVRFYAGMELPVMNWSLSALRHIRKIWAFDMPGPAIDLIQWAANLLRPFGTDRGGMMVKVIGTRGDAAIIKTWRLMAEAGQGPYVPGIIVRTLLRNLESVEPGARACLSEVPLTAVEDAMSDLAITTYQEETRQKPLFQEALGEHWDDLSPQAKALHSVQDVARFSGIARVDRGTSMLARLVASVFGFPPAAEAVRVTVTKTVTPDGELWERDFAGKRFRSLLNPSPHPLHVRERFGPFNFEQALPIENGVMRLDVKRGWFLGITMPRWAKPKSQAQEFVEDGKFHFDVALSLPLFGSLIVRYRGWLEPSGSATGPASN